MKKLPKKQRFEFASNYLPLEYSLSERIVGQPVVCKTLASLMSAYKNRRHCVTPPIGPRILFIGPSSAGKTFAAEIVANELNLPSVTINCGSIVPNGYKGSDLASCMRSLIAEGGTGGIDRVEGGNLVFLDELDKVPLRAKKDQFLEPIQYSFLPILNGDPLLIEASDFGEPPVKFTTKNSFLIMAGVFANVPATAWTDIHRAQKALVKFGFCEEFVSRISHIVYFNKLKTKEVEILVKREEDSLAALFQSGNLRPSLTPQQRRKVVNFVGASPLGIRGSRTIIYEHLQKDACASALETFGF